MWRLGLACLVLVGTGPQAFAQSRGWVPWGEVGRGGGYSSGPSKPSQNKPQQWFFGDDDDDDSVPVRPGGNIPYKKSNYQYPAVIEGGPRPEIEAKAPPVVPFQGGYASGSIVIDTSSRALYYVLGNGRAYRYSISVGRDGFRWKGTEKISRVAAWPDWHPPQEMRERDPRLPEVMTGGIRNPLGAKALYLGSSLYRIHGTNDTKSIGYAASSGCFRMMNANVLHLATLAGPGTTVHVLDHLPGNVANVAPQSRPKARKQG